MDAKTTTEQREIVGCVSSDALRKSLDHVEMDSGARDGNDNATGEKDYSKLKYPEPWRYEKFFLGGYSPKRMLRFKNPKSMYYAINLFAGELILIPLGT